MRNFNTIIFYFFQLFFFFREGDEARRKLKIIREEHEKVEKMNLEVKQSIDAMARKLESVEIETPNGGISPTKSNSKDEHGKDGSQSKMIAAGKFGWVLF